MVINQTPYQMRRTLRTTGFFFASRTPLTGCVSVERRNVRNAHGKRSSAPISSIACSERHLVVAAALFLAWSIEFYSSRRSSSSRLRFEKFKASRPRDSRGESFCLGERSCLCLVWQERAIYCSSRAV